MARLFAGTKFVMVLDCPLCTEKVLTVGEVREADEQPAPQVELMLAGVFDDEPVREHARSHDD